jgi:hypothetical protein
VDASLTGAGVLVNYMYKLAILPRPHYYSFFSITKIAVEKLNTVLEKLNTVLEKKLNTVLESLRSS